MNKYTVCPVCNKHLFATFGNVNVPIDIMAMCNHCQRVYTFSPEDFKPVSPAISALEIKEV